MGLIGSSNIPVNSATESFFFFLPISEFYVCFVNKNLPSCSGLIVSKLQQKFSFKIHVNLAPDVQNMFASFKVFLSARNYFVNNFLIL